MTIQEIIGKVSDQYQGRDGFFRYGIGRLEQVVEHDAVTLQSLRDYAAAEAVECRRRADYHARPEVARFYHENVALALLDEARVMEKVVEYIDKS